MGTPYDTTHAEENQHCLVCHKENAIVIHHPVGDAKEGDFGHIQVICNNHKCRAEIMIPRLTDPLKNYKKNSKNDKTDNWF